ncbi:MAG: hypothetical protein C0600_07255 [Ignavibacteria bacterium]|nr:MAG: hypothetical protein C0600_07255 [Ignavibacteria bacterium]
MFAVALLAALSACSPPDDSGPPIIVGPNDCDAEWRGDTATIRTSIRFEAFVDTNQIELRRFSDSGLRIAVVCIPPDTSSLPYRDIYSISANYLDIPATGLPFNAVIPPGYFVNFSCARLAAAVILVYRDENGNKRYDLGEPIVGADEQSLYAFVQGDVATIPTDPFETVYQHSNVLIRYTQGSDLYFQSSPDFLATIFIINVRGEKSSYDLPYPWHVSSPLLP